MLLELAAPKQETAGRFADIPKYDVNDNYPYYSIVNDYKGMIIYTNLYLHGFFGGLIASKLGKTDLDSRTFELPFEDLKRHQDAEQLIGGVRARKTTDGVEATIPLAKTLTVPRLVDKVQQVTGANEEQIITALIDSIRSISPEFVNFDKLDVTIPAAKIFKTHPGFAPDLIKMELDDEDGELAEMMTESVKAIRFMGDAVKIVVSGQTLKSYKELQKLRETDLGLYKLGIRQLLSRFYTLNLGIVVNFEKPLVEHVTQSTFKEAKLQYMVAWIQSLLQFGLEKKTDYTETLNPVSVIAKNVGSSAIIPVKRTNDEGLLVDARGFTRFIPEVGGEVAERVENEVESGNMRPTGEFAGFDLIDPKSSYEEGLNKAGAVVQKLKRAGRNQPVYTDWRLAKFTYTNDSGKMIVSDLSACRPLTATHAAAFLNNGITAEDSIVSALSHLGRAADALGFKFGAQAPVTFADWFAPDDRSNAVKALTENSVISIINLVEATLYKNFSRGFDEKYGPQVKTFLEEEWSVLKQCRLRHINANSVLLPFIVIAKAAEHVAKNYESRLSEMCEVNGVHGTSLAIAVSVLIHKYAPNYKKLVEQDAAERKTYLEPKLEKPQDLKLGGIPFVKNLTLLPHQAKVFNYLKNLPKKTVVDVAAGGGKTIIGLVDIALNMGMGRVKKPLILCPSDLKKNYFVDGNKAFAGRVNFVVISTVTVRNWGFDKLRELINSAPINTIFISDFEFLSAGSDTYGYGTQQVTTSSNLEFMREFPWDGLWVDEVHKLKNSFSTRTKMAMQIATTIEIVRQMSGTYLPDTYEDVVALFAQLEPTVFGDVERFNSQFKEENKGRGAWIPNAGRMIRDRMTKHANVVTVKRREWMSLLPPSKDFYHGVELSPNVYKIYQRLLEEQIELIKAEIKEKNPKLLKPLQTGQASEDEEEEIQNMLDGSIHMARLEEFLCDPLADEAGQAIVDENEAISPKVKKVHDIIREHVLVKKLPGKVLVFTKNHIPANAIYKYAPADLKKHLLLYRASGGEMTKEQYLQKFESDPEIWALIGVEDSLNTGRNLQFCSALVRVQAVWNWGQLEQGEARILRPNIDSEFRKQLNFHFVFVNKTVDVTKASRMISKLLATAKWYEPEDPRFQNLPDLPPVRMTLDNIAQMNDWEAATGEDKSLKDYIYALQDYRAAEQAAYQDFLKQPDNFVKPMKLAEGHVLPGSALLPKVPYIPDIELYGMDELGLVKYNVYESENQKKHTFDPTGLIIHTEDGEGECVGSTDKSVRVRINNRSVSYPKDSVFVVQKKVAKGQDIRERLGKLVGADTSVMVKLVDKPAVKPTKQTLVEKQPLKVKENNVDKPIPNTDKRANNAFNVYAIGYNEFIALGVDAEDPDVPVNELKKVGFVQNRQYHYMSFNNWRQLKRWYELASEKLEIVPAYASRIESAIELWQSAKDLEQFLKRLTPTVLRDFLRATIKPTAATEARPYLLVDTGQVYIGIDARSHAASWPRIRKIVVPGAVWEDAQNEMFRFCATKQEAKQVLAELARQYNITNIVKTAKKIDTIRVIGNATK